MIEPFAAKLAMSGKTPFRRRAMLRLIGQALLVQHRVSGRVAVEEKPDVLWDRHISGSHRYHMRARHAPASIMATCRFSRPGGR